MVETRGESAQREVVLELARSQIGLREEPLGSNRVKYNREYYGMEVKGPLYPWCCVFQWWLFQHAGVGELFYGGGKTASCTALYRFYQKRGQSVKKEELRPGDLVFFVFDGGSSGGMNHVGLCESAGEGWVVTIDGNTGSDEANGGTVARKRRSLRYVGGAARPAYREEPEKAEEEADMKIFERIEDMPDWARPAAEKALRGGYIRAAGDGTIGVWEASLQPLVWMDRAGLLDGKAKG